MRYITRYVVLDVLKTLTLALVSIALFMILIGIVKEAISEGLGLGPIARLIPFLLPDALKIAVPASVLLAVCAVFGRMASDNEFVAIKSVGISPMAVIFPALAISFVISVVAVWLNDLAVSWGEPGMKRVVVESLEQIVYRTLETRKSYSDKRFSIRVKGVQDRRLMQPSLILKGTSKTPDTHVSANQARLQRAPHSNSLEIELTDIVMRQSNGLDVIHPGTFRFEIPILTPNNVDREKVRPGDLSLAEIPGQIARLSEKIEARQKAMASIAAFQLVSGDFQHLAYGHWKQYRGELERNESRLKQLHVVPWRLWANGFSCLCFALVGIPISIRLRSANFFTTFSACFLPVLLLYYPLLMYGVDRAKSGAVPPYMVWLGNFACLLVGTFLLRRVLRY